MAFRSDPEFAAGPVGTDLSAVFTSVGTVLAG
jgi:hypothetical protein